MTTVYDEGLVTARKGKFSAQVGPMRGYLFLCIGGIQHEIAQTVYPEWHEVHGSIDTWIRHVSKQKQKRLDKIKEIMADLKDESDFIDVYLSEAESIKDLITPL